MPGIITYYFVYFKDEGKDHHGFPIIIIIGTLIGCCLSTLFLISTKNWLILKYPNVLFERHYYQLIILTIASIVYLNLDSYYKGFYKVVLSTFLKETMQRILILAAVLLFLFKLCDFDLYVLYYGLAVLIPSIILLVAIAKDKHFKLKQDWAYITPQLKIGMITVGFFNILASISSYSNGIIDNIMITSMCGLPKGGIYTTTILFGMLVSIPSRTLRKITSALLAEAWKESDSEKVFDIYKKSCVTLYIIGFLIFLGIWANIDNILQILPHDYAIGKWAIFWSCLTNLIEMTVGAAGSLIGTSKHYKVQTYQGFLLVGLLVILNYLFIPMWGLTGAAFATTISFLLYNSMRHFYIMYRWNMQPYGKDILYVTIVGMVTFAIVYFIPHVRFFLIDTVMRGSLVVALFGLTVYGLRISPEINTATDAVLKKIPIVHKLLKNK